MLLSLQKITLTIVCVCKSRSMANYWIPKLHYCPYKQRDIAGFVKCLSGSSPSDIGDHSRIVLINSVILQGLSNACQVHLPQT